METEVNACLADLNRETAGESRARKARLAVRIARRLEDRILGEGWPVGFHIGREAELAAELGVSRWTLREAVRILEASGFVTMRKGAGGGLFVASSASDFVCRMAANYFAFVQVSEDEFGAVLCGLNRLAISEAMDGISDKERRRIHDQLAAIPHMPLARRLEAAGDVHQTLIRSSANPALQLFLGALGKLTFEACIYSTLDDDAWLSSFRSVIDAINDMAIAMLNRELDMARTASDAHTAVFRRLFASSFFHLRMPITSAATQRAYDFFPPARPMKKVDSVERAIREIIFDEGWPVGASLGSEKELASRFGVGRWVLREALRSLEQLGVIEMGRGGRSGVRVLSPDPTAVVEACRRHLRREGMKREQVQSVQAVLQSLTEDCDHPLPISTLFSQILAG